VNRVRYKLINEGITFFLSDREVTNYDDGGRLGLKTEGNIILDYGLLNKVQSGTFPIVINGHPIILNLTVVESDYGFTVQTIANGYLFEVSYIDELDKYKVYRGVVKNFKHIVKEHPPLLEWHVLESKELLNQLTLTVGADDPDVLDNPNTLEEINRLAGRMGYFKQIGVDNIQTFGQNELTRRTLRFEKIT
jgi:hypothetical protein